MQRRRRRRWWSRDDGAGSVLMLAIVAVVLMLAGVAALLGRVSAARHEAQSAADLAALAGASAYLRGAEPCAVARQITAVNGATLGSCEIRDGHVIVTARVPVAGMWASASARAGPG